MIETPVSLSRRQLLALLLSTVASLVLGRRAGAGPSDQGIGGTGLKPPTDESDRGLGGTGVIGTIRKFGSIVVNDLRIAYPEDAQVRIDGRPAAIADLKIGQVVRVAASGKDDALSTRTIDVTHEVVGPVEKVDDKHVTVLGQKVSTEELKGTNVKAGDFVAVSGLRRNDGTIAASLIEPRPGARSRIAGPLKKDDDGVLTIGGRQVVGVDPRLAGQRVVVEGVQSKVHFVAVTTTSEKTLLPRSVRKLSIESYVERHGDSLRSGSGYAFEGGHFDVPAGRSIRAVLQTNVDAQGRITVDSFRAGGRTYFGPGGGRGGGRGPGGRGPGGRGPGGRGPGGRGPGGRGGGGPGGRGPGRGFGGREPGGRGGFGEREFGGRGGGGRGRGGGGGRRGARGAGPDGGGTGGGRLPMDFGRGSGGSFDGGRGGGFAGGPGGSGGFSGGPGGGGGGGGFGGPSGGGFGGGGFGGPGGGGFGGGGGGGGGFGGGGPGGGGGFGGGGRH